MSGKRGSILILAALVLAVAAGIAAEALHWSRIALQRTRLERIAEPAALGAVLELDGTRRGLSRARERAAAYAGRPVQVDFAENLSGPWNAGTPRALYTRITVAVNGPRRLSSRVIATQRLALEWEEGLLPFSVEAAVAPAPGAVCRIDYFGSPSPREARPEVLRGLQWAFRIGDLIPVSAPPGEAMMALDERVRADTDLESPVYAEYARRATGNGRRLIPVVLRNTSGKSTGAAAFFLSSPVRTPIRGEFVGGYLQGARFRAVSPTGYFFAEAIR